MPMIPIDQIKIENRTVAFIDILGFRDRIESGSLQKLAQQYEYMVRATNAMNRPFQSSSATPTLFPDHHENEPWCQRYIFSDSIILISNSSNDVDCLKLLVYAWRLFQSLLAMKLPARGAIYFGELYENRQANVVLGRALTGAHALETKQQWIGIAIDKTVENAYPDLFLALKPGATILSNVFFSYPVPFKDGSKRTLHTLNWRFNLIVEKGTRSLFTQSDDPLIKEKIQNTLEYAKAVIDSGKIYVSDQENLVVELRSMYIGDREPTYPHGDDL